MKKPHYFEIDAHEDDRGKLIVTENFPFEVKRSFWIHLPHFVVRGKHANKGSEMLFFCMKGHIGLGVEYDGYPHTFAMNDRIHEGVYIPNFSWVQFKALAGDAIALVFASTVYDEADYIFDHAVFKQEWPAYKKYLEAIYALQQHRSSV